MKNSASMIRKIFIVSTTIGLTIAILFTTAVIWPLPKISVPDSRESILLKSINIVDVNSGEIIPDMDILIQKNRISDIDSSGQVLAPHSTLVIDGSGKFLMPGLWDMHTHSSPLSPWIHHPLYIANGVTGIRDMSGNLNQPDSHWSGTADRIKWNEDLENNVHVGPRYVLQSSFQIDGSGSIPDDAPEFFKVEKEDDIPQLLEFYRNEGADFIKVYAEIPAASYIKMARSVSKYGLHIAGHKPLNVTLEECINLGQRSFEHGRIFMFDCFPGAEQLRTAQNKREQFSLSMQSMVDDFDITRAEELMNLMRVKDSHWTPTLQTLKMSAYAEKDTFTQNPHLKYIPTAWRALIWNQDLGRAAEKNIASASKGLNMKFYQAAQKQIAMANEIGVPIMLGTDVTDTYVFPGFSVHTELKDLTESGLSNLEALQAATTIPAKFSNLEKDYGSVEEGKIADLVILNTSPLSNIENSSSIDAVILNGIYYDQKKLSELKDDAASVISSIHLNAKFIYNLLSSPLMRKQFAD